jgi:voltage-gated potassium channel
MNITVRRLLTSTAVVVFVILCGGGALFWLGAGRWSLGESLYMSVISVSTVGFGELPGIDHVRFARVITVTIILAGLGSVAFFQSSMTALIVENVIGQAWRRQRMKKIIEGLSQHVVVAGIGSTGKHVVEEMIATSTPFVVIDSNLAHLQRLSKELMDGKMLFVHGDATTDHILIEAGVDRAKGVIAALTHDPENLFVTLSSRALNARARIVTKVVDAEAVPKMIRAGANATVSPTIIGGRRLASELIRPDVVEFLDQMMNERDKNLRFEEVVVPPTSSCVGRSLRDVPLRRDARILVVAIRDKERRFHYSPGPDHVIEAGSVLVVLGAAAHMQGVRDMIEKA